MTSTSQQLTIEKEDLKKTDVMYNPPQITKNPQTPAVLIAGGAGFIGSHLIEHLLANTFRTIVVDSLRSGNREYITHYTGHPRFAFIQYDLNQGIPAKIESVDYIINLAGEERHLSEDGSLNKNTLVTNALATRNLLELTRVSGARMLLTSSISIYQGAISSTSLKGYFGQTPEEEKSFSFNEAKRFAESLAFEYFKNYNLDVRIARLGEVYGPRMDLKSSGNLGRFIENILKGDNLIIYGDGLEKEYYCYITDCIDGITKSLFKENTAGSIFPITDLTPVTILEQAYLVKSFALPGTQIIFKPNSADLQIPEVKVIDGKVQRELRWKPKISLKEGLRLTLESFKYNKAAKTVENRSNKETAQTIKENFIPPGRFEKKKLQLPLRVPAIPQVKLPKIDLKKISVGRILLVPVLLLLPPLLIGGSPLMGYTYHLGLSYLELNRFKANFREFKFEKFGDNIRLLNRHLEAAQESLESAPFLKDSGYRKFTDSAVLLSKAALSAVNGAAPFIEYLKELDPNRTTAGSQTLNNDLEILKFSKIQENLSGAIDFLELSRAEFKKIDLTSIAPPFKKYVKNYGEKLDSIKDYLRTLNLVIKTAPAALGFENDKNYILIFQNSNELRPTGGFIGALGKITLRRGQIQQVKIIDVYDIDGQIDERQIRFPQPTFLSENLQTGYLHLRDANYSPDFPESAERIKKLYETVTEEEVDGIIAADLITLERILNITGPIFLPTYNESVNGNNVFERTQFHSEAVYFPGSTQKKTFLSILSQQLIDNIFSLNRSNYFHLIKEVEGLLREKHILVYIPEEQANLSQLNWDGRIINTNNDYVMIVDANVGSTKSNYFIERSINYYVERNNREGEFISELRVEYKHNGTSNTWPGGPYKNFLRVYVPRKSALIKTLISTAESDPSSKEDDVKEITNKIEVGNEYGKTVFSTLLTVETGRLVSVIFTYILPPGTASSNDGRYRLILQKQPGTRDGRFTFKFKLPFGLSLNDLGSTFKLYGDTLEWQGQTTNDVSIEIPLKPLP